MVLLAMMAAAEDLFLDEGLRIIINGIRFNIVIVVHHPQLHLCLHGMQQLNEHKHSRIMQINIHNKAPSSLDQEC